MRKIEPNDCAKLIYAIIKLNLPKQELLKKLVHRLSKTYPYLSNDSMVLVYGSLARAKFRDLTHFRTLHIQFAKRLHRADEQMLQFMTPDRVSTLFWSYGRFKMLSFAEQNVLKELGQLFLKQSQNFTPKQVSIIMHSLARLKYKQKQLWIRLKQSVSQFQKLGQIEANIIIRSVIATGAKSTDIPIILKCAQSIAIAHSFKPNKQLLAPRFYVHALNSLVKLKATDLKVISMLARRILQVKDKFERGDLITAVVAFSRIKQRYHGAEADLEHFNIQAALRELAKQSVKWMKKLDRRSRVMLGSAFKAANFYDSGLHKSLRFYRVY